MRRYHHLCLLPFLNDKLTINIFAFIRTLRAVMVNCTPSCLKPYISHIYLFGIKHAMNTRCGPNRQSVSYLSCHHVNYLVQCTMCCTLCTSTHWCLEDVAVLYDFLNHIKDRYMSISCEIVLRVSRLDYTPNISVMTCDMVKIYF